MLLPCCEDAENVHEEAGSHHVTGLETAGAVHDSIGSSGHGKHERIADTHGAGHHEVERVAAEADGHLAQDGHQDVGAGGVAGHLSHESAGDGDDETHHQGGQLLESIKTIHQVEIQS